MSTSIGNANVYQFLARTTVRNGNDWQKQADNNGDGLVSYSEFVDFIDKEYSSQMGSDKLNTRDLNIFWNSIDTDQTDFYQNGIKVSGAAKLDSKEIAKMDAEMQDYIDLETAISLAIANKPSEFSAGKNWSNQNLKDWNSLVSKLITAEFETWRKNKNGKETFENYLKKDENLERILLEATGKIQTDIEIEKLMKMPEWQELANLGYNIGEDKEIDAWIKEYINQYIIDNNLSLDTISGNHKDIINAVLPQIKKYLEEKQKIETDNAGKITGTGTVETNNVPTDAQKAALKAELTKEITTAANTILASLNLTGDFTDIIAKFTDEYRDSLLKIHLIGTSEGYNALKELTADNIIDETAKTDLSNKLQEEANWLSLKNNIENKFKTDFENTLKGMLEPQNFSIVKNKNLIEKVKNDILSNIKEFTNNSSADPNQLWTNKIKNVALGKIGQLLANELQGGYDIAGNIVGNDKNYELSQIDTIYKDVTELVKNIDDENEKLKAYAELAIGYMNEVVKMGYSDVVTKVAGNNYKNVTSWVNTGDITKIDDVVNKVKQAVEAEIKKEKYAKYSTIGWTFSGAKSIVEGNGATSTVATTVKDDSGNPVASNKVTYGLKGGDGFATITAGTGNAYGTITISKNAPVGPLHLTVYAMVDGHEVGTAYNITINVTDKENAVLPKIWNDKDKDLLKDITGRTSLSKSGSLDSAKAWAKNSVETILSDIKTALKDKYDQKTLDDIATKVQNYYSSIIDKVDNSGSKNRKGERRTITVDTKDCPPNYKNTDYVFVRRADSSKWSDKVNITPTSGVYMFRDGEDKKDSIIIEKETVKNVFIDFFKFFAA